MGAEYQPARRRDGICIHPFNSIPQRERERGQRTKESDGRTRMFGRSPPPDFLYLGICMIEIQKGLPPDAEPVSRTARDQTAGKMQIERRRERDGGSDVSSWIKL